MAPAVAAGAGVRAVSAGGRRVRLHLRRSRAEVRRRGQRRARRTTWLRWASAACLLVTDPGIAANGVPARVAASRCGRAGSRSRCSTACTSSPPTPASSRRSRRARAGPSTASSPSAAARASTRRRPSNLMLCSPASCSTTSTHPSEGADSTGPRCCRSSPCRRPRGPAPSRPPSACSTCWRARSRRGSATLGCARCSRSSTPSSRCARRGHRERRHRHPVSRARELHRAALLDLRAEAPRAAGAVLRRQPGLRHVVGAGLSLLAGRRSGARCPTATTSRRDRHGDGRDVRRPRLRQRRGPRAARQRLPHRRAGAATSTPTATLAKTARAARHVRGHDGTRGVPLHLRAGPERHVPRPSCSRPASAATTPSTCCPRRSPS